MTRGEGEENSSRIHHTIKKQSRKRERGGDAYEQTAEFSARHDARASTSHHKGNQIPRAVSEEQERGVKGREGVRCARTRQSVAKARRKTGRELGCRSRKRRRYNINIDGDLDQKTTPTRNRGGGRGTLECYKEAVERVCVL